MATAPTMRNLGADEVIDVKSQDFQAKGFVNFVRCADAVIDTVGGKTQTQLFALVKPGGVIVSSVVRPDAQHTGECRGQSDYFIVDVNSVQLARLADMLRRKEIQTRVGSALPLVEARAAHQMLGGMIAHKPGKIVLQVV
jgi:NADPH:quinone reductase-like Zn-dependent oxidoreductase